LGQLKTKTMKEYIGRTVEQIQFDHPILGGWIIDCNVKFSLDLKLKLSDLRKEDYFYLQQVINYNVSNKSEACIVTIRFDGDICHFNTFPKNEGLFRKSIAIYPSPLKPSFHKGYQPTDKFNLENLHRLYFSAESQIEPTEPFDTIKSLNELAERSHNKGNYHEAGKLLGIIKRRITRYEENEMYKH